MQNQISTGIPSTPNRRGRTWLATVVMLASLILLFFVFGRSEEPTCGGKSLSQWLLNTNPDFDWVPNDVYGHVHNELWDRMIEQDPAPGFGLPDSQGSNQEPSDVTVAVQRIGTNALPLLIEWMSASDSSVDRLRKSIADRLPNACYRFRQFVFPGGYWQTRVMRRHIAAHDGFVILGTNAEPALPALSNLFFQGHADMPLAWAISGIGPKGIGLLTDALASPDRSLRDEAALALGLQGDRDRTAMPALVSCVKQGRGSYSVLGAIGRIGGNPEIVVPALINVLQGPDKPPPGSLEESMSIVILGIHRERARPAVPLLLKLHETGTPETMHVIRRALKNIAPETVAGLAKGNFRNDEDDSPWW